AAGLARDTSSFAAAPSISGTASLAGRFPLVSGNWRRASSSASRIWRTFTLQAMATTTAATAAVPIPSQAATAGGRGPWGGAMTMPPLKHMIEYPGNPFESFESDDPREQATATRCNAGPFPVIVNREWP